MIDPPIRTFIEGVLIAEVMQLGFWIRKHGPGKTKAYFTEQAGTLITNQAINFGVAVLWIYQYMDKAMVFLSSFIPGSGDWATSGVPYTPPVGLLLGVACDFFGDDLAFNLIEMARGRLFGKKPEEPATPPGPAEVKP